MQVPSAFLLLTVPNATLVTPTTTQSGSLALECVTVPLEAADSDVYLVLRVNTFETPVDPSRAIDHAISNEGVRTYTFRGWDDHAIVVTFPSVRNTEKLAEDFETLDSILAQYAELRGVSQPLADDAPPQFSGGQDLRGHLVLINEDNGEVVGALDNKELSITEDPALNEKGAGDEPVVLDFSDDSAGAARAVFVQAILPEEQDWITKSATLLSQGISSGTNLLVTIMSSASSYYIANSASSTSTPTSTSSASRSTTPSASQPPSKALVFLTSERTRKGLAGIHAVSGQAVQVSQRTTAIIDSMVRRAMGGGSSSRPKGKERAATISPSPISRTSSSARLSVEKPPLPPRSRSPSPIPPPPYNEKPPLPPRKSGTMLLRSGDSKSLTPPTPALPSDSTTESSTSSQTTIGTRDRLLLSADLILSTIDDATKRLIDAGGGAVGDVVGHKYGPHAAANTALLTGTARNVAMVYVDMRGVGRRALLRRAGKEFVKAKMRDRGAEPTEAGADLGSGKKD